VAQCRLRRSGRLRRSDHSCAPISATTVIHATATHAAAATAAAAVWSRGVAGNG
jgi:hypothetical protein